MRTIADWLGLASFVVPFSLFAQSDETLNVGGAGTATCGDWIEEAKSAADRGRHTDWVLGFLTAFNYYNRAKQLEPPTRVTVSAWIDKYCRDNPLHYEFQAAAALLEDLGGPKATHRWKR